MDIDKISQNPFINQSNIGAFGTQQVKPQVQPIHEPIGFGGASGATGGIPYNSRIQPINYAEVTAGINRDTRNSNLQEGALGENALYVEGGRVGGRLNLLS